MLNTRNTNLILRWRIYPSKTLVVSREGSGIRIILDSSDEPVQSQTGKRFQNQGVAISRQHPWHIADAGWPRLG